MGDPRKRNWTNPICFSPYLYRDRNLVERFFNKIKQCGRVTTPYDKFAANYLAFVKLAPSVGMEPRGRRSSISGYFLPHRLKDHAGARLPSWPHRRGLAVASIGIPNDYA